MKFKALGKSILVAASLFVSASASANLIFDFSSDLSNNEHSVDYTMDGYTLSVSAFKNFMGTTANVNRETNGFGVTNSPGSGNVGAGETLSFSLDKAFMGTVSIYFNLFNTSDSALVAVDGLPDMTIVGTAQNVWTFDLPSAAIFSITGLEVANTSNDKFRITGLEFIASTPSNATPSNAIPEPSTLAILSLGLIGFGMRRFAKK
jgi:hypothetical protein